MDGPTLADAMGHVLAPASYEAYSGPFTVAMAQAGCTTINRAAMFCAQVGHESLGLRYMEELASGAAYEGRRDLGNIQAGDGVRFKGRGPIQLTGRANYGAFGRWCRSLGLITADDFFVRNPALVSTAHWGFLAAAWYWTVARPQLNSLADRADVAGATRAVNGGVNGLPDRAARWTRCRALGTRLLPVSAPVVLTAATTPLEDDDMPVVPWTLPAGSGQQKTIPVPPYSSHATLSLTTGWSVARVHNLAFVRDHGPGLSPQQEQWGGQGSFDLAPNDRPTWDLGSGCTSVLIDYDATHDIAALVTTG